MTAGPFDTDAMTLFVRLLRELDQLDQDGRPVPCRIDPEPFTSDDYRDRAEAVTACGGCPAMDTCRDYAAAASESHHVWGARDRGPRSKPKTTRRRTDEPS